MNKFIGFEQEQFSKIFPFFIVINNELIIESCGRSIMKLNSNLINTSFNEKFQVKRPFLQKCDFEEIKTLVNQVVFLGFNAKTQLSLRGQFEIIPDSDKMIFIGSPWFDSMKLLQNYNLNLHDFAYHDPIIDMLHVLNNQEIGAIELTQLVKRINQQKNDLKEANRKTQEIALFPTQNPDPLIRIDFDGKILITNPIAKKISKLTYNSQVFTMSQFWQQIVKTINLNSKKLVIEAKSDQKIFSFAIVPLPDYGYINIYGRDITLEKNKEEQLRILSLLAAENTHAVVIADKKGKIEWINRSFELMTGYSLKDIIGKKPGKILQGPGSNQATSDYLRNQIINGDPFDCEILNYTKTNNPYWVRIQGQALRDSNDKIIKYFAIQEDITSKREIEEKLRDFTIKFKLALEQVGDNVWEHDLLGKDINYSNPSKRLIDITPNPNYEIELTRWKNIHEDDLQLVVENEQKCRNGEIDHYSLEYRIWSSKSDFNWILDRGVVIDKDKQGLPLKLIGTHTDITKQKNTESALKIKEEKYRNIIANINLGLLEVDNDEIIQYANSRFCNMIGYSLEELAGKKASTLFVSSEDEKILLDKRKLRIKGVADAYEVEVRSKLGERLWWMISGAPNYNDKGDLIGSVGIHLDITKSKKLEHDLIVAKEKAEASTMAKEKFLANMSHEIRTPMNAIMGMSNLLRKSLKQKNQLFYIDTILGASDNLLVILNDILDISKIEAGKLTIEKIGFKMETVIARCIQVMAHRAEEKDLSFTNSFSDPNISKVLIGDPYRINQVLMNLISNSIKFTEKGGVDIVCKLIKNRKSSQVLHICVRDTGIGMKKEFVSKLFQKFTQEDESISRRYGGTGLGLSITKELIELMGGLITIKSEKNIGTSINLELDLKKGTDEDMPDKHDNISNTKMLVDTNLLVVDDNEMNLLVASSMLKHYGASIKTASNGQEAIEMIKKDKFDLILMDVQMPVLDGLEATRQIRENISKKLPVIALTAYAVKGDEQKFLSAGMNDYLSKPFEESKLVNVVTKWLSIDSTVIEATEETSTVEIIEENLYNISSLESIAKGNVEFIEQMIGIFIDMANRSISEIKDAYHKDDFKTISKVAHRLKPSIDNMGIVILKEEIRELESSAEAYKRSEKLEKLLVHTEKILKEVIVQLKHRS